MKYIQSSEEGSAPARCRRSGKASRSSTSSRRSPERAACRPRSRTSTRRRVTIRMEKSGSSWRARGRRPRRSTAPEAARWSVKLGGLRLVLGRRPAAGRRAQPAARSEQRGLKTGGVQGERQEHARRQGGAREPDERRPRRLRARAGRRDRRAERRPHRRARTTPARSSSTCR